MEDLDETEISTPFEDLTHGEVLDSGTQKSRLACLPPPKSRRQAPVKRLPRDGPFGRHDAEQRSVEKKNSSGGPRKRPNEFCEKFKEKAGTAVETQAIDTARPAASTALGFRMPALPVSSGGVVSPSMLRKAKRNPVCPVEIEADHVVATSMLKKAKRDSMCAVEPEVDHDTAEATSGDAKRIPPQAVKSRTPFGQPPTHVVKPTLVTKLNGGGVQAATPAAVATASATGVPVLLAAKSIPNPTPAAKDDLALANEEAAHLEFRVVRPRSMSQRPFLSENPSGSRQAVETLPFKETARASSNDCSKTHELEKEKYVRSFSAVFGSLKIDADKRTLSTKLQDEATARKGDNFMRCKGSPGGVPLSINEKEINSKRGTKFCASIHLADVSTEPPSRNSGDEVENKDKEAGGASDRCLGDDASFPNTDLAAENISCCANSDPVMRGHSSSAGIGKERSRPVNYSNRRPLSHSPEFQDERDIARAYCSGLPEQRARGSCGEGGSLLSNSHILEAGDGHSRPDPQSIQKEGIARSVTEPGHKHSEPNRTKTGSMFGPKNESSITYGGLSGPSSSSESSTLSVRFGRRSDRDLVDTSESEVRGRPTASLNRVENRQEKDSLPRMTPEAEQSKQRTPPAKSSTVADRRGQPSAGEDVEEIGKNRSQPSVIDKIVQGCSVRERSSDSDKSSSLIQKTPAGVASSKSTSKSGLLSRISGFQALLDKESMPRRESISCITLQTEPKSCSRRVSSGSVLSNQVHAAEQSITTDSVPTVANYVVEERREVKGSSSVSQEDYPACVESTRQVPQLEESRGSPMVGRQMERVPVRSHSNLDDEGSTIALDTNVLSLTSPKEALLSTAELESKMCTLPSFSAKTDETCAIPAEEFPGTTDGCSENTLKKHRYQNQPTVSRPTDPPDDSSLSEITRRPNSDASCRTRSPTISVLCLADAYELNLQRSGSRSLSMSPTGGRNLLQVDDATSLGRCSSKSDTSTVVANQNEPKMGKLLRYFEQKAAPDLLTVPRCSSDSCRKARQPSGLQREMNSCRNK